MRNNRHGWRARRLCPEFWIRLRTKEGLKVAKAKVDLHGKQPKLNGRQEAHLVALLKSGKYSTAEPSFRYDVR